MCPPACLGCGELLGPGTGEPWGWCWPCASALLPVAGPCCPRCGTPVVERAEAESECSRCAARPPPWQGARAGFVFGESIRAAILRLKRLGPDAAPGALVDSAVRAGVGPAPQWGRVDAVVPVPLHPARLRSRGFNQAALLARAMGRHVGAPVRLLLRRTRATPLQPSASAARRWRNVAGAFDASARVRARTVLLVDDVLTTGATATACTAALVEAGARAVYVWTLARAEGPVVIRSPGGSVPGR